MQRLIAFLRAINVGGRNVTMETLRAQFEALGLENVTSFIASGNIIFHSSQPEDVLRERIEQQLEQSLGYEVATFLRSDAEVARIAAHQAFSPAELSAAKALNVGFLYEPLTARQLEQLHSFGSDIDAFSSTEREVYWLCRKQQSDSKFSNARLERALQVTCSFRSISTIQKLAAKYSG